MQRRLLLHSRRLVAGLTALAIVALAVGVSGWLPGRSLWLMLFALLVTVIIATTLWSNWQRDLAIREAPLPQFLKRKLRETYPQLIGKDCDLVERGLRQFFLACKRSDRRFVAMPSRAVDVMWHEFILHTRAYQDWCDLTLGRFLHHTPAETLGAKASGNDGLRRAWTWACRDEAIDPRRPSRLPLLFALDAKLGIPNGFSYVPDCGDIDHQNRQGGGNGGVYCGTSFSDGSYSGDADGLGGADSSPGDGGSDAGGGDGGGGCGGGGGGGD